VSRIESIFNAIRETEQRTFSKKDWQKFVNSMVKTKKEAEDLRSYLVTQGLVEYVVRITEKGKARAMK
jgi:hypothetical protein